MKKKEEKRKEKSEEMGRLPFEKGLLLSPSSDQIGNPRTGERAKGRDGHGHGQWPIG